MKNAGLNCWLEAGPLNARQREYNTEWTENHVECFVSISDADTLMSQPTPSLPDLPRASEFRVRLSLDKYISPGLAVYVRIDGEVVSNKNKMGFEIEKFGGKGFTFAKNEKVVGGEFMQGKPFDFGDLQLAIVDEWYKGGEKTILEKGFGDIDVIILRCNLATSGSAKSTSPKDDNDFNPVTVPRLRRKPAMECLLSPAQNFRITEVPQPNVFPKQIDQKSETTGSIIGMGGLFDGVDERNEDQHIKRRQSVRLDGASDQATSRDGEYHNIRLSTESWDYIEDGSHKSCLWLNPRAGKYEHTTSRAPSLDHPIHTPNSSKDLDSARQSLREDERTNSGNLHRRGRTVLARDPNNGNTYEREDSPTPEVHLQRPSSSFDGGESFGRRYSFVVGDESLLFQSPAARRLNDAAPYDLGMRNTPHNAGPHGGFILSPSPNRGSSRYLDDEIYPGPFGPFRIERNPPKPGSPGWQLHGGDCTCSGCCAWKAETAHPRVVSAPTPGLRRRPSVTHPYYRAQLGLPPSPPHIRAYGFQETAECYARQAMKDGHPSIGEAGPSSWKRFTERFTSPRPRQFSDNFPSYMGSGNCDHAGSPEEEELLMAIPSNQQLPVNVGERSNLSGCNTAPKLPRVPEFGPFTLDDIMNQANADASDSSSATPVSTGRLDGSSRYYGPHRAEQYATSGSNRHVQFNPEQSSCQPTIEVFEPLPIRRSSEISHPAHRIVSQGPGDMDDIVRQAQYDAIYDATYQRAGGKTSGLGTTSRVVPLNTNLDPANQTFNTGFDNNVEGQVTGDDTGIPAYDFGAPLDSGNINPAGNDDQSNENNDASGNTGGGAYEFDMAAVATAATDGPAATFTADAGGAAVANAGGTWDTNHPVVATNTANYNTKTPDNRGKAKVSTPTSAARHVSTPRHAAATNTERLTAGTTRRPVYWDTIDNPYAVFRFKYCSEDVLANTLKISVTQAMSVEEFDEMSSSMTHDQLRAYTRSLVQRRIEEFTAPEKKEQVVNGQTTKIDDGGDFKPDAVEANPGITW